MPGMMDTILNLGLNDEAAEGLAARTGNARFAFDSYRRLIQMFGEVVEGIDGHRFESALSALEAAARRAAGHRSHRRRPARARRDVQGDLSRGDRRRLPVDAREQLLRAVRAVFESWDTPRAQVYRRAHDIPDDLGTAVNVVQMVFGNKGDRSGTGVAFTRDPSTGESGPLRRVPRERAGRGRRRRHPHAAADRGDARRAARRRSTSSSTRCAGSRSTTATCRTSSSPSRTSSSTCCRRAAAKRTAAAALKAAVAMVDEGLITREEAVGRIDPAQLDQLLHPMIDPKAALEVAAKGLNASPGAASGGIVFDADTAVERAKAGPVILVRWETTPDDIHGMIAAQGILTVHGGMTSHAAVVARGMGKPCVAGCDDLTLDDGDGDDRRPRRCTRAT